MPLKIFQKALIDFSDFLVRCVFYIKTLKFLCVLSLKALALLLFCLIQKFYVFLYFSDQSAIGHLLDFSFGEPVAYIRRYSKKAFASSGVTIAL